MLKNPDTEASLAQKFQASEPCHFLCLDNILDEDFVARLVNSYPSYSQASKLGRGFNNVNESMKLQVTDWENFPDAVRDLCDLLSGTEFIAQLSRITGIDDLLWDSALFGGGMQFMNPGGYLDVHVDFNQLPDQKLFRRVNLIIYLNSSWQAGWGGLTEIWDRDVKKCCHAIEPKPGRCLLFETTDTSFHGVSEVRSPGITRQTFSAYYYTKEPRDSSKINYRDTIFRARPDEYFKGLVQMPAERVSRQIYRFLSMTKRLIRKFLPRT